MEAPKVEEKVEAKAEDKKEEAVAERVHGEDAQSPAKDSPVKEDAEKKEWFIYSHTTTNILIIKNLNFIQIKIK